MWVQSLGRKDPLKEGMATHFSILTWRIPWAEELGGLLSTGSQRVGHDWSDLALTLFKKGLPQWLSGVKKKKIYPQCRRCRRHRLDPQVQKIPWRRAWQLTPVFFARKTPWIEEPGGLWSMESQRVRYKWSKWAHMHTHCSIKAVPPAPVGRVLLAIFGLVLHNSNWCCSNKLLKILMFQFIF